MKNSLLKNLVIFLLFNFFLSACSVTEKKNGETALFKLLPSSETGITFQNNLSYTEEFNVYTFRNFYNGGGVAIGDINNDGLPDIFFTGNQVGNKLYLNKGDFQFEDITTKAGLLSEGAWSTGVSMADVNGDGWLDIYVCKSGDLKSPRRHNELFINNQNLTFSEKAKQYGIADIGLSTQAAFFDYDKDDDLDLYLLNNSFKSVQGYDLIKNQRSERDTVGGNKLYRNDGDQFTDVSEVAGIYGSSIGFGLGVSVADVNNDHWPDIYISNDFFEKDYLYINNQKGGFKEMLEDCIREISLGSMGADIADINNDGLPEIFVTEMLPDEESRLKTKASFENWNKFVLNKKYGYYNQFPRNVLNLNNGDNTFSEIGRMAGVAATDWSWGALIFDMDNDGFKDIFVSNGIYKDLTDQDYIRYMADVATVRRMLNTEKQVMKKLVDMIPSNPVCNYAFKNNGDLTFTNKALEWGMETPSFSNGSAYADLDNDGDLDLVLNNVNMPCFIYENQSNTISQNSYLKVKLRGAGKNTFGIGAKVSIFLGNQIICQELNPMKGFESSVDYVLSFGLGKAKKIDSLKVLWPDGRETLHSALKPNQFLKIHQKDAYLPGLNLSLTNSPAAYFDSLDIKDLGLDFHHKENQFNDFERDGLIFHMLSNEGPKMAKADVNNDGLEDLFIGGAKDSPGSMFIQLSDGKFKRTNQDVFEKDKISEDAKSLFFDCDGDNDLDLYVCSGGNEFSSSSSALLDRLYLNNGKGIFQKSEQLLPTFDFVSSATVACSDYDNDGDLDLFVGTRLQPFKYGMHSDGYLLENDGKGIFKNVTGQKAPQLHRLGMITDATWLDFDGDADDDLIIVGEYMAVRLFENKGGSFKDISGKAGLNNTNGWWNCVLTEDITGDGLKDLIIGNHGLNSRFKASPKTPVSMYVHDFDDNGTIEQIITLYKGEKAFPVPLRHDLVSQIPSLKERYLKYESYKEQGIEDIFSDEQLKKAVKLSAYILESSVFISKGNGQFERKALPKEAQFSPIYTILSDDFNKDGIKDLLIGGNFYKAKPEVGTYDGSYGLALQGLGNGEFIPVKSKQSGFLVKGEVRSLLSLKASKGNILIIGKNDQPIQAFKYN